MGEMIAAYDHVTGVGNPFTIRPEITQWKIAWVTGSDAFLMYILDAATGSLQEQVEGKRGDEIFANKPGTFKLLLRGLGANSNYQIYVSSFP